MEYPDTEHAPAEPAVARFGGYQRVLIAAALLFSIPPFLAWVKFFGSVQVDDAYIAYRFSENWASGLGLTWNPGQDPVEGFTSFAWVALGAFAHWISGAPLYKFMHFFGLVCWLALATLAAPLCLAQLLAEKSTHREIRQSGLVIACATAVAVSGNALLGLHAMHGLETMLQVLVLTVAACIAMNRVQTSSMSLLAITGFVAFTVRPDALAFVFPLYAMTFIHASGRSEKKSVLLSFGACLAALTLYTAAKWLYFGYPVPNTAYIKQGAKFLAGAGYVYRYGIALLPLAAFYIYAGVRGGFLTLVTDRRLGILLVPAAAFTLAYAKFQPIAGFGHRFLVPTLPIYILGAYRAYVLAEREFWKHRPVAKFAPARFVTVTGVLFVAAVAYFSVQISKEGYSLGRGMTRGAAVIDYVHGINGRNLAPAAQLDPPPLLGTGDVGQCPYFSGLPTLDLIGLCDETIAHEGALTHAYLQERDCDLYILQDLYFKADPPRENAEPAPGALLLDIDGKLREVDMDRYQRPAILNGSEHSGAGTTYQVITSPGFLDGYVHVGNWPYGTRDHLYAYLKKDYPHFDALAKMLKRDENDIEDKIRRLVPDIGVIDDALLREYQSRYNDASPTPPAATASTDVQTETLESRFGYSTPPIKSASIVLNAGQNFYALGWVIAAAEKTISVTYGGRSYPARYAPRRDINEKFAQYPFRTGWIVEIPSAELEQSGTLEFYMDGARHIKAQLYVAD